MPISGREFERAPVKDAFEWQVDRLLTELYPNALSTREIHERLVGPLIDTSKLGPEWRDYLRRINESLLRITDLRLAILQLRFGYPEFRFVSMPGGRVLKHWRGRKPGAAPPPKPAPAPVPVRKPAARPATSAANGGARTTGTPAPTPANRPPPASPPRTVTQPDRLARRAVDPARD
jgi:hypothetical protein